MGYGSNIIREKIHKTYIENWLPDRVDSFSNEYIPLFDISEYKNVETNYLWLCKKCDNEFYDNIINGSDTKCPVCYPKSISNPHQIVLDFIQDNYDGKILVNDRKLINPLDILIPELKLAIEINENYWHRFESGKDKNYHLNKTELVESRGYRLLHIFEDEIVNKVDIVKSRINNFLGKSDRIFARKCIIDIVPNIKARNFLNKCHIQGADNSKVRLGLYDDLMRLVAVMTFSKPRFNKNIEWELVRYSTLLNTTIVGGASKLLKYFIRNYHPKSIISYADRRWSQGNLYKQLGFDLVRISGPNYFYMKEGSIIRETRNQYQKHKLEAKLEIFDPSLTEYENMINNGYSRIYDCGNYVFEMYC